MQQIFYSMIICSREGDVKLLNSNLEILAIRKYYNREQRARIIKGWAKLYGNSFNKLVIQISPVIDEERDDKIINLVKRNPNEFKNNKPFKNCWDSWLW